MLTDQQKEDIREIAAAYRNAVRRGDVTAEWAAESCAGHYTYPYAEAGHFAAVRDYAAKCVK